MFIDTDSGELQNCPAAVDMDTGDIYINRDVWDRYTEAEKKFIIQHELGHYLQQTDSEIEADLYALNANFGKVHKSLKSSFTALDKSGVVNENRWNMLYENALTIDAEHGNTIAQAELEKIQSKTNFKNRNKMRKQNKQSQITYIHPMAAMSRVSSFDGEETYPTTTDEEPKMAGMNCGITIGNCYFKITDIILAIIAIILIIKLK